MIPEVKIGPLRYRVVEDYPLISDEHQMLYGEICYSEGEIKVDSRSNSSLKPVILWHEMLHGILSMAGVEVANEDQVIEAISHGIVMVLQDNPDLYPFTVGKAGE